MINVTQSNFHWNYFLALESDLAKVSRYVEFCESNFDTFSVELAHLLLAAASEVDVLAKCVCEKLAPERNHTNIHEYQVTLVQKIPGICETQIRVPRYGLEFKPLDNWATPQNPPDWWSSYNKVKHVRNRHFNQATLKNALSALGALLILNYHEEHLVAAKVDNLIAPWHVTRRMRPQSQLLRLPGTYYHPLGDDLPT
jgi:hypothetical protein